LRDEDGRALIMQDHAIKMVISDKETITCLSPVREGMHMSYLRLDDRENELVFEFCWDCMDYLVYIVNDNGKTVDKA
jgi:hypothetical protein